MPIDLTNNTVAQYKMNDTSGATVTDSQGTQNGELYKAAVIDDTSNVTTSHSFPLTSLDKYFTFGTDDYNVKIDNNTSFNFTDGAGNDKPFSISCWVNHIDPTLGIHMYASKYNAFAGKTEWLFYITGGVITWRAYSSGGNIGVSANSVAYLVAGQWYYLTATYDGSNTPSGFKLYIDGSPIATNPTVSPTYAGMSDTDADVYIGAAIGGGGTLLGHLEGSMDNVCIFDKVLTTREISFLYSDGEGTEQLFLGTELSSPTLISPNGGEVFKGENIEIEWSEPQNASSQLIWYEIFITDDYEKNRKLEFLQIATIPSGNSSYTYSVQKNLKGDKCRIGIRSVSQNGDRGEMSLSADNFTIDSFDLPSPALMEPIPGNAYYAYIPFVFDHSSILGKASQRAYYQIHYSSDNQNIDWTLLTTNIMVGSDPTNIDVSSFTTDTDYIFKIELVDDTNVSVPLFIDNININSANLFLIDTTPPRGFIKIVDNTEYIKETSVVLSLDAYDKTSGIKEIQIEQENAIDGTTDDTGPYVSMTPLLTWDVTGDDGVKLIKARYKDYGDNTILDDPGEIYFRTYKNLNDREVTSFLVNDGNLYSAFAGDASTGVAPKLYKDLTFLFDLDGEVTSLIYYNNVLYLAIKDDENKGILQRRTADSIETVTSLYSTDSVINTMEVYDDTLFLGLDNGELLRFTGSTVLSENSDYLNKKSINYMKTDSNILYIFFKNTTDILIMYKDALSNYVFDIVTTEG
jgi:hypothetical protein